MSWNSKSLSLTIRIALLIILFLEISNLSYTFIKLAGLYTIVGGVGGNDFYRTRVIDRNRNGKWANISLLLSILMIGGLSQVIDTDFTKLYVYLTIPEIVQIQLKKKNKWLILVVFIFFCLLYIKTISFYSESVTAVLKSFVYTDVIPFWSIFFISYLHLNLLNNKKQIENLNTELIEKVDQLQRYSDKVKEISTLQERQRISQQLHDMLGHSLVALKLHLEAAVSIIDTDTVQTKTVLEKSQRIIDQSFLELKETVNELNKGTGTGSLSEILEEMALRFSLIDHLEVTFSIEINVDDLADPYKEMIVNISREAITNSLKHGQSSKVNISIAKEKNMLTLLIKNNGLVPKEIVASTGVNGMRKQVSELKGDIQFLPGKMEGLTIKINVPIEEDRYD